MTVYVGVDGGGTRTRAVVVDAEGRELGRGVTDGAVATARDPEPAARAVERAVRAAAAEAGTPLPAAVLWAGLAGGGSTEACRGVRTRLEARELAHRVEVGTDVEAAFHDAFPSGPGVLLIAGTGSIAWSRSPEGVLHRVGGWGQHLGDEGSGYALGIAGLRLVTRAADGRAPATTLEADLLGACGVAAPDDLVDWIGGAGKKDVAALAPVIAAAAERGDPGAAALVEEAVDALLRHVDAAIGPQGPAVSKARPDLVLWGGLIADGGPLEARVRGALEEAGYEVARRRLDPARGAAGLARTVHSDS